MPGLRRIILIATHLPGVVELKLDGHTNVCGTNASGKTTLQRLVPVFFGELPSKVVPRTRKRFSEFYLPHANSYLIYEYEREEGQICQAVVTRKDGESVQYRFVAAPFAAEQLLVEVQGNQVQPMLQEQWLKQLKQLGIDYSNKIQSTSEFRAVIQNDASVGRANSRENTRLRQMAARYSLVAPKHRIRHMEKLVSAVHAKEGKMDTLRTMLAAIFEEDGLVKPTTTVRNTKAREWITQMRQTKRLQGLHQEFQHIRQQAQKLQQTEEQLQQLKPVLEADFQRLKTERADTQQQLSKLEQQQVGEKQQFDAKEEQLNSQLSETNAELDTSSARLDAIQQKYDRYLDSDMEQLDKDMQALPLWRENLEQQQEHYQILIEQHKDLESQLLQQKNKLNESLERLRVKNQSKIKTIDAEKAVVKKRQESKETELRGAYEKRRDQQMEQFEQELAQLTERVPELQYQAKHPQLNDVEQENLALAEKRLELAQRGWQQSSEAKTAAERDWQAARLERDNADQALIDTRRQTRLAQEQLGGIHRQLSPEQGSLRHFLRENLDGWEQSVGKLIHAQLLERKDLSPEMGEPCQGLMGVKLDLGLIESPDYAQDEEALKLSLQQADKQLELCRQQQKEAENLLERAHQQAEVQRAKVEEQQRRFELADQEVRYASDAKLRVQQEQRLALDKRKAQAQKQLDALQKQKAFKQKEKAEALEQLKQDFEEQLLEFRSGWQEELAVLDEQIQELEGQVEQKREQNREQIKQLEEAFNQELAKKDIDPRKLQDLKAAVDGLKVRIHEVAGRRDELNEYKGFIELDWQKLRPQLLEQEAELKSTKQHLQQQRSAHSSQYQRRKAELGGQVQEKEQVIHHIGSLLTEVAPLIRQLGGLKFNYQIEQDNTLNLGDQQERISRCNESLESHNRLESKLKQQLNEFENMLGKDAGKDFIDTMQQSFAVLDEQADCRDKLPILERLLSILESKAKQIVEQGETIGQDLADFFKVFSDINRKIAAQSKRLTDEVADDLVLDGIAKSEVKILSTVDELNFWTPLKNFAQAWSNWRASGVEMPGDEYLDSLADVVEVLPNDASFSIESLLRLELRLNEGGSDLVIKNDRQLLESSSHGMAYLILCKFLLAFTRLLRNQADIRVHWPIDEIGTLAYHNVEKLFNACDANRIDILGAFPNPESEVLMLFKNRYLIDKQKQELQRIEPKLSRIAQRLHGNKVEVSA